MPYNLYMLFCGKTTEEVEEVVRRMSEASSVSNYRVLVTEKELKKVPPRYIMESDL